MQRALELAAEPPFTSPNPRVGAVVVRAGVIIGEGRHEGAGTPHAEAVALEGLDATGTTLYVNLEPCVHQGKMPPCAPLVAAAGVTRVVAAIEDPDTRVAGGGFEYLRGKGVEVDVGTMAAEAERLNAPFLHHRWTGRPLVTLKLAAGIDGRFAARDGTSRWITGPESRRRVHRRRLEADAILVGAGTVVADDPSLTVRDIAVPSDARRPVRIVSDSRGRVPATARIFDDAAPTIVATTMDSPHDVQVAWKEAGAEVLVLPENDGHVAPIALLEVLGERGFLEVYCEGGAPLATSLLRARLIDRIEMNLGPVLLGAGGPSLGELGSDSIEEAERWKTTGVERLGDDVLWLLERTS